MNCNKKNITIIEITKNKKICQFISIPDFKALCLDNAYVLDNIVYGTMFLLLRKRSSTKKNSFHSVPTTLYQTKLSIINNINNEVTSIVMIILTY